MEIKVVSLKTGTNYGHEDMPTFRATIAVDGKKAFQASDDGSGAVCLFYETLPGGDAALKKAADYAKTLPDREFTSGGEKHSVKMDLDLLIHDLVEAFEKQKLSDSHKKRVERAVRKHIDNPAFLLFTGNSVEPDVLTFNKKKGVLTEKDLEAYRSAASKYAVGKGLDSEHAIVIFDQDPDVMAELLKYKIDGSTYTPEQANNRILEILRDDLKFDEDKIAKLTGAEMDSSPRM